MTPFPAFPQIKKRIWGKVNIIVDFCAPRKKLIIELDGSQHLEQEEYDSERTAFLESRGYRVLRAIALVLEQAN